MKESFMADKNITAECLGTVRGIYNSTNFNGPDNIYAKPYFEVEATETDDDGNVTAIEESEFVREEDLIHKGGGFGFAAACVVDIPLAKGSVHSLQLGLTPSLTFLPFGSLALMSLLFTP